MTETPTVEWAEFLRRFSWRQGEHVTAIGPTGTGKTTLLLELLRVREDRGGSVVVLASKPRDRVLDRLEARGYRRFDGLARDGFLGLGRRRRVVGLDDVPVNVDRVLMWPPFRGKADQRVQRAVFREVIGQAFGQGAWTVVVEELHYATDTLGLGDDATMLYQQGRSVGVSVVAGAQRPRFVPRAALANATHLFFWRTGDDDDLRRIGGLGTLNSREIRETVMALPQVKGATPGATYCLYVNTRDSTMVVTKPPAPR